MDLAEPVVHPADASARGSAASRRACLFASLAEEQAECRLPVRGRIPDWLCGTLLRNGPAVFETASVPLRHWFDGAAMLHRFRIECGTVRHTSRLLRTRARDGALRTGRPTLREFATDPCARLFGPLRTLFRPNATDNANISIGRFGDDFAAMSESALPIRFDPHTLRTLGVLAMDGGDELARCHTTAHPLPAGQGRVLSHLTRFGRRSRYELFSLDPATGRRTLHAAIPVARPAYMHSFAASPRHVLLSEFPFTTHPLRLMLGTRSFIETHRWTPRDGTRFNLIERVSGRVRVFRTEAFFAFHHVNAFDDGDDFVVDLIGYDDPSLIDLLYLDRLRSDETPEYPRPLLRRYRLDPRRGTAELVLRGSAPLELPRIDPRRLGARHETVYGVGGASLGGADFPHAIGRQDLARDVTRWWEQPGCFAGEPVFVPRPDGAGEADGILLSVVLDTAASRSFLLVLDAASLHELARAETAQAIPAGLHGGFFADTPEACLA